MTIKSIILYSTTEPLRIAGIGDYHQIPVIFDGNCVSGALHIRYEVVDTDPLYALDMAKPRPGEIVLNSIPLP